MDRFALFTDVSLNPELKAGVGAYLLVPVSLIEESPHRIEKSEAARRLVVKRFESTSSTRLEVQTVLWALEGYRNERKVAGPGKLHVYSDSQCVAGLLRRRPVLEGNDFLGHRTHQPLKNGPLYQRFYEFHDELSFEVLKAAGHSRSCSQDPVHRLFSFVDKKVREELKLWMCERGVRNKALHRAQKDRSCC